MSSKEYNQLLKFLYFEGYADSYAEAEELLESMSDEEFENLLEAKKMEGEDPCWKGYQMVGTKKKGGKEVPNCVPKEEYEIEEEKKEFPTAKVERQIGKHTSKSTSSWSNKGGKSDPRKTSSYDTRSRKMSAVKSSVERGEDPRKDSVQGDQRKVFTKQFGTNVNAKTVDNEKSAYTPGGLRAHQTRAGGYRTLTRKEELEMQEGLGRYQTSAGHWKDRDENPSIDDAVSDMLQKRREAAAKKARQEKLKAQGLKRKDGTPVFEEVIEYLFVEGFADTIENAEVMAENISETWVNEIMEAYVDLDTKKDEMRRRANRTLFVKGDWNRANKIDTAREKHDPAKVQAKAAANRKKGSVTEENYEIDEAAKDQSDKQIDQGVKKTYKAGNVLDNTHQGRSPGLNKLPAGERKAKTERMRDRLKARRDDLFQERGNREDAKREQLKKLLGL